MSDEEIDQSDDDYAAYYEDGMDSDIEQPNQKINDPEHFEFSCLTDTEVEKLLNESVEKLSTSISVTPSLAKLLLHIHKWDLPAIVKMFEENSDELLVSSKVKPKNPPANSSQSSNSCPVCMTDILNSNSSHLACGHDFCNDCWSMHFKVQINEGISSGIQCMASKCSLLVPEDFFLNRISCPTLKEKYQQFAFSDYVQSHPNLRFCPGSDCNIVTMAKDTKAKRVICSNCKTNFCFKCGNDYHAPTECYVIKQWLTKCADDSETANYISAHTKDCPKCNICIEKNGGCNHMQCYNCKADFCWMCMKGWKEHGSDYYECSRYKDNPGAVVENIHAQAREALKKYLHYYERWENHNRSLKLEKDTVEKIRKRITEKVMSNTGTWIDWQYLFDGANLLAKCRYTLQYTYPYAYYCPSGPRKDLFEYQQAQLEAEIENLSWKIERAEMTDRGELENQMDIVEKRRTTLLADFLP